MNMFLQKIVKDHLMAPPHPVIFFLHVNFVDFSDEPSVKSLPFTFLRDPVSRQMSSFQFIRRKDESRHEFE